MPKSCKLEFFMLCVCISLKWFHVFYLPNSFKLLDTFLSLIFHPIDRYIKVLQLYKIGYIIFALLKNN